MLPQCICFALPADEYAGSSLQTSKHKFFPHSQSWPTVWVGKAHTLMTNPDRLLLACILYCELVHLSGVVSCLVSSRIPLQHVNMYTLHINRKDYAFQRQFDEKPSIIPGCPVHITYCHVTTFLICVQMYTHSAVLPSCLAMMMSRWFLET